MKRLLLITIFACVACSENFSERGGLHERTTSAASNNSSSATYVPTNNNAPNVNVPVPDDCYSISGNVAPITADLVASDKVLVAYSGCGFAISKDGGLTFTQVRDLGFGLLYSKPSTGSSHDVNFVGSIAVREGVIFASQDIRIKDQSQLGVIVISKDFGNSWTEIGKLRNIDELRVTNFHLFAVNDGNGSLLYAFRLIDNGFLGEVTEGTLGCHWSWGSSYCWPSSKNDNAIVIQKTGIFSSSVYRIVNYGKRIYGVWWATDKVFVSSDNGHTYSTFATNLSMPKIFATDVGGFVYDTLKKGNLYFIKAADSSAKEIPIDGYIKAVGSDTLNIYVLLVEGDPKQGWKFKLKTLRKDSL